MKMKTLALVALTLAVGSVSAATPVWSFDAKNNIGFSSTPLVGSFVDSFTFTLPYLLDKASGSVTTRMNLPKDVDFTSVVLSSGTHSWNFTQTGFDGAGTERWVLDKTLLSAGAPYTLTLSGTTTGGAAYAGQLAFVSQPVPEPATYGMMLGGLGLVGLMARRRKAKAA
ncbi:MAG: FxDxF family PEP-CTERM protein [Pseudomonadota bacterium]